MVIPKTTGPLGIREPHYNNINEFAVFVKVISEAIFSCGIIEAAQKQFTRALGLIWCRVSHFHDFFWKSLYFKIPKTVCCKPLILPMPTKTLRREADKRLFSGVAIHFITGFISNFLYESSGKVGYATQLRWLT